MVDRTGERWFEAELHRLKGSASSRISRAPARQPRRVFGAPWLRRESSRPSCGSYALRYRWLACGGGGPARRGARPARADLRLVHGGFDTPT